MQKIPCHSKKLKADHFLKCSNQDCGAAMFWSDKNQGYELPYSERQESTQKENGVGTAIKTSVSQPQIHGNTSSLPSPATGSNITEHLCPVCTQPLELYKYTKDNQQKQMLRCSDVQARRRVTIRKPYILLLRGYFGLLSTGRLAVLVRRPRLKQPPNPVVPRLKVNLAD